MARIVGKLAPFLSVMFLALLITLLLVVVVDARPPLPFSPYGTVQVNEENVPEGTEIGAWCGGVEYAVTASFYYTGVEDSLYYMDVPGDDPDTQDKDGCLQGEVVTFTIGFLGDVLEADQEAEWASGSDLELDLTAFQPLPALDVEKLTNDLDADDPPGPFLEAGETVTWTFLVTNTGNVTLTQVVVVDDQEGEVACPKTTLVLRDWMTCVLTGTTVSGHYGNVVTATGLYESAIFGSLPVSDTDRSHYYNSYSIHLPLVVRNS